MISDLPKDLLKLRGDARYLRQILLNLLSNATKFTDPGGEIAVRASILGAGEMCLSVSDTGRGIAIEDQERVFEHSGRAVTTSSTRTRGPASDCRSCAV